MLNIAIEKLPDELVWKQVTIVPSSTDALVALLGTHGMVWLLTTDPDTDKTILRERVAHLTGQQLDAFNCEVRTIDISHSLSFLPTGHTLHTSKTLLLLSDTWSVWKL